MIATIITISILAQNSNTNPAPYQSKLTASYAAVFEKLAGHGFAGSEVIIELDQNDPRHWKAAIWIHSVEELLIPIAEQTVSAEKLQFQLLPFGKHVSDIIGKIGREVDRKAWTHAKCALPKADNLDWATRIVFILYSTGSGCKLTDEILANHEVDVLAGLALATYPSRGGGNLIPIGRDGSVTRVLRPCLGGPLIPGFETPGFPKSH